MAQYLNPPDEPPLTDLVSDVSSKVQELVRKELELAKLETKEQMSRGAKAGGLLVAGGVVGFVALLLLAMAAAWGLAEVMPAGFAYLIVGVLFVAVAGACAQAGRKKLAEFKPVPEKTMQTVKQDVQTAKSSLQRGASW